MDERKEAPRSVAKVVEPISCSVHWPEELLEPAYLEERVRIEQLVQQHWLATNGPEKQFRAGTLDED